MAGMSLDRIWLEHLKKSESIVKVCQVIGNESMNVYVPKNRVMSRRSGQHCDIPESYIF